MNSGELIDVFLLVSKQDHSVLERAFHGLFCIFVHSFMQAGLIVSNWPVKEIELALSFRIHYSNWSMSSGNFQTAISHLQEVRIDSFFCVVGRDQVEELLFTGKENAAIVERRKNRECRIDTEEREKKSIDNFDPINDHANQRQTLESLPKFV